LGVLEESQTRVGVEIKKGWGHVKWLGVKFGVSTKIGAVWRSQKRVGGLEKDKKKLEYENVSPRTPVIILAY